MKINHNHWFADQLMNGSAVLGMLSSTAVAYIFTHSMPVLIGIITTVATHFISRYLKKKYP